MLLPSLLLFAVVKTLSFPSSDWPSGTAEAHGLSSSKLQNAAAFAGEQKSGCFAVIRDGVIVHESYFVAAPIGPTCMNCTNASKPVLWNASTTSNIHSGTKSITSALVGIAQDRGLLNIDDPVYMYGVPSWAPPDNRSSILIRDVLSMSSGLHWGYYSDYFQGMFLAKDKTAFGEALSADHPPASWWEYNNMAVQVLEGVLRNATHQDVADFAEEHLFSRIGLAFPQRTVNWYRDDAGQPIMYDGIQLGCRTLARMGYLWLNNGSWAGKPVVSKEYVRDSLAQSTKLNAAYGYLWWLGKAGPWVLPSGAPTQPHGGRMEGNGSSPMFLPGEESMYGMLGGQGQIAIIDPGRNAVYIRQGQEPPLGDYNFQRKWLTMINMSYI